MNKLKILNLVLLILLALASGLAKVLRVPDEVLFFQQAGFGEIPMVVFGVLQVVSGLLIGLTATRVAGTSVLAVTFICSTLMILMAGQMAFAIFSLLPIIMAGFVLKSPKISKSQPEAN